MTKTLRTAVLALSVPALSVLALLAVTACGSSEQISLAPGGNSAAGAPAQDAATTTVPGPTELYLGDLIPLSSSGAWQHGTAKINTAVLEHSVWATTPCHPGLDGTGTRWDFDLNRQYTKISGTVGVTDDSEATSKFRVELVTDDKNVVGTFEVGLGVPLPVDSSLAGALRLTIKITQTAGPACNAARVIDGSKIAFGDVKISK